MIYRVMYDTNAMDKGSDYMEMAQLLGDAALPGEAEMVIEKGMATGLFTDQKDKDRASRLQAALKTRADADKKGAAQFDAEAAKNAAGELDVKSGEVYFGAGDFQGAVTAISRGLQKQGIKHLDEAYVYLGRSLAQLKNNADAKKAFFGLKNVPNISPRVMRLWDLYSEKLGS
jgi:Flp pilus assembly protein TadD